MNKEMGPADLLRGAARLIDRAILKLDVSATRCGECGGRHFTNKADARVFDRIGDLPTRLRTVADSMDAASMIDAMGKDK